MSSLPVKLMKEPLIEAVFQLRFSSKQPASTVIPGYLFSQLGLTSVIETLEQASIPFSIRDKDPLLKYSCFIKLEWGKFVIFVGDRALNIACTLPYPGWGEFRDAISSVLELVAKLGVVDVVERYSLKYVDLVESESTKGQIQMLNLDMVVADHMITDQDFNLRVGIETNTAHHIVNFLTNAIFNQGSSTEKVGVIVDVDSIVQITDTSLPLSDWMGDIGGKIDELHIDNKEMFFKCLRPETVELLEPKYE